MDINKNEHEIIEFYAGEKRLAKLGKAMGLSAVAVDQIYDKKGNNRTCNNSMDINTSGGFAFLRSHLVLIYIYIPGYIYI